MLWVTIQRWWVVRWSTTELRICSEQQAAAVTGTRAAQPGFPSSSHCSPSSPPLGSPSGCSTLLSPRSRAGERGGVSRKARLDRSLLLKWTLFSNSQIFFFSVSCWFWGYSSLVHCPYLGKVGECRTLLYKYMIRSIEEESWTRSLLVRVEQNLVFIMPSFCTILLEHKYTTTFSCSALISLSHILASSQIFTWDDWVMTQAMIRRWKSSPIGGNLNRHHLLFYPSFVEIVRSSLWKLLRLTFLRI